MDTGFLFSNFAKIPQKPSTTYFILFYIISNLHKAVSDGSFLSSFKGSAYEWGFNNNMPVSPVWKYSRLISCSGLSAPSDMRPALCNCGEFQDIQHSPSYQGYVLVV